MNVGYGMQCAWVTEDVYTITTQREERNMLPTSQRMRAFVIFGSSQTFVNTAEQRRDIERKQRYRMGKFCYFIRLEPNGL